MSNVTWVHSIKGGFHWKMQRWCEQVMPLSTTWSCHTTSCVNTWNQENLTGLCRWSDKWNVRLRRSCWPRDYRRYQCGSENPRQSLSWFEAQWRLYRGDDWWLGDHGNYWTLSLDQSCWIPSHPSVMTMPICVWQRWARDWLRWWTRSFLNQENQFDKWKWGVSTVSTHIMTMPRLRRWASSRWQMWLQPRNSSVQKFTAGGLQLLGPSRGLTWQDYRIDWNRPHEGYISKPWISRQDERWKTHSSQYRSGR